MKYQSKHWRQWIYERFGNKDKYFIEVDEEKIEYLIGSTNKEIKTQIIFYFMRDDDDDVLYDIYFRGDENSFIWPSPFPKDPKYKPSLIQRIKSLGSLCTSLYYKPEFVERLEKEWLCIPLQKGWKEELQYLDNQLCRAKLKIQVSRQKSLEIESKVYDQELNHYEKVSHQEKWDIDKNFYTSDWQRIKFWMKLGARIEHKKFNSIDR